MNRGHVTSSTFSRFGGVLVGLLGAVWFATMLATLVLNRPGQDYALIPLWLLGAVSV